MVAGGCDIVAMETLRSRRPADPSVPRYITSVNNVSVDTGRCLIGPQAAGDFVLNNPEIIFPII